MDIGKAVAFVEENGSGFEKYLLRFLLGKERSDEIPLQYFRGLQNRDGGFPYNNAKGKASCVSVTNSHFDVMIELKLTDSEVFRKTVEYLLRVQNEDGSWSESDEIKRYDPPFWDLPGDLKTSMWLTADITNHLMQAGFKESQVVRRAAGFLLSNRDEEGKFAGYLQATWISVGVFGQLSGIESEIVKKALTMIDRSMVKLKDGTVLAWCLQCFHAAGLDKENPVVRKCINELVSLQQENGSWISSDGETYTVSATVNVLKALRKYALW